MTTPETAQRIGGLCNIYARSTFKSNAEQSQLGDRLGNGNPIHGNFPSLQPTRQSPNFHFHQPVPGPPSRFFLLRHGGVWRVERCEVNHGARRSHMIHLRFTILSPTLRSCLQSIRSGLGARQHFLSATTVINRYSSSMSRKICRCGHKVHVFPQLLSLQVTSVSSSADIKRADRLAQTWV